MFVASSRSLASFRPRRPTPIQSRVRELSFARRFTVLKAGCEVSFKGSPAVPPVTDFLSLSEAVCMVWSTLVREHEAKRRSNFGHPVVLSPSAAWRCATRSTSRFSAVGGTVGTRCHGWCVVLSHTCDQCLGSDFVAWCERGHRHYAGRTWRIRGEYDSSQSLSDTGALDGVWGSCASERTTVL